MIDIDTRIKRLNPDDVKGYSNKKLVDDFEVACRFLLTGNDNTRERELKHENITILRDELYRRMKNHRA